MKMPNCRNDENYNQKYLNDEDTNFLQGFDWCVEQAVDNFFDNEMYDLADAEGYLGHVLCEQVPQAMQDEYEVVHTYGDNKDDVRKVVTYADLIRQRLLYWVEICRNELVTSMIDSMSDDEYAKIKELVDGQSEAQD